MPATRMALIFAAVLIAAGQLLAQSESCVRRSIPVNVMTDRGQMVTGLTEKNFSASMHHQPVKILSVAPDEAPRRVVIVLDASGSMIGELPFWQLYLEVARDLVATMPLDTSAGLVVFSPNVLNTIPLTNSRSNLQQELTSLQSGISALPKAPRNTALWDALAAAASEFDSPRKGMRYTRLQMGWIMLANRRTRTL
jgi:von Willebrand factor type A domain